MQKLFKINDKVIYIPSHAHGDQTHEDVEYGVVTGLNSKYVFVRFGNDFHSKTCTPDQLVLNNG